MSDSAWQMRDRRRQQRSSAEFKQEKESITVFSSSFLPCLPCLPSIYTIPAFLSFPSSSSPLLPCFPSM
eukprot:m.262244 g.262244  ORF g.262244 m.262244 type:complete len:69 (+) comp48229_c0_seq1:189-395(+)